MAIANYSLLLGTKAGYRRDAPGNFGKYFHGHIDVQTPGQLYNTAIDVDSERPGVSVQWRVLHLRTSEWTTIFSLPDGLHALASTATSGAVDYIRDPRLHNWIVIPDIVAGRRPWWRKLPEILRRVPDAIAVLLGRPLEAPSVGETTGPTTMLLFTNHVRLIDLTPPWKTGTDQEALTDLEAMLVDCARVVVFGAAYPAAGGKPPGLHDIHQNQGDPPNSTFAKLDEIWQDGLTVAIHSDGTASALMNKFSTQSDQTDDLGRPV